MEQAIDQKSERYSELLRRITGVYAANVQLGEDGEILEVHLLAGSGRHAKQVARDARSALFSTFGLDVDYQKFSVAQLKDTLGADIERAATLQPIRLRSCELEQSQKGDRYRAKVTLIHGEESFEGVASVHNTPNQRKRAVADAVLSAIHDYLGADAPVFLLLGVQTVATSPVPVVVVILECLIDSHSTILIGAAELGENEALSIEKATLDGVNRKLSMLRPNKEG